jgi:N12 class adenine-specific DNA methylase
MTDQKLFHVEVNFLNRGQSTFRTYYRDAHDLVDDCLNCEMAEFYDPIADSTTAFRGKDVLAVITKEISTDALQEQITAAFPICKQS